jgi:hypothetical protein
MDNPAPYPKALSKSPRRWLRFSLRTLVLAVTLFCIWLGLTTNRVNRQRRAVAMLNSHGGSVTYDFEADEIGRHIINGSPPPGPDWLRNVLGIDYYATVVGANVRPRHFTDDDAVAPVAELPQLRGLYVSGASLTDSMLAHLKRLTELRCLSVFYATAVTDDGWEPLAHLANLTGLNLIECHVTDSSLLHVGKLTRLESLWLTSNPNVTDAGLQHFKNLAHLKYLQVQGTKVTAAGVEDLKRALPTLNVAGY